MPTLKIHVINDAIYPAHNSYDHLSAKEAHVRLAMLLVTAAAPPVAAVFALFVTQRWSQTKRLFSFGILAALWFLSVTIVGVVVYAQKGETNRVTFILAVLHGQIEVLIVMLLLNATPKLSLLVSWAWGAVLYLIVLVASDPAAIFITVSIVAGANDFFIVLLFLYAKLWYLALGAVGHVASAVILFTNFVVFIPVIPFNATTFISLWIHLGATIGALLLLRRGDAGLPSNPMSSSKVTVPAILVMQGLSFAAAAGTTVLLVFVAPV